MSKYMRISPEEYSSAMMSMFKQGFMEGDLYNNPDMDMKVRWPIIKEYALEAFKRVFEPEVDDDKLNDARDIKEEVGMVEE